MPKAAAMDFGTIKYGRHNWLLKKIRLTHYMAPIERHLNAPKSGQDTDPESGLPHWAHIAAGCSIVMDAMKYGSYIDDRAKTSDYEEVLAQINQLKRGWFRAQATA
jgi:hypothetical protein